MSLANKVSGTLALGLLAALSLSCSNRIGEERISYFNLPVMPFTSVVHEDFKSETSDEIKCREETTIFLLFGNMYVESKRYGEDKKYLGMYKTSVENQGDGCKIRIRFYDANGKLTEVREHTQKNKGLN